MEPTYSFAADLLSHPRFDPEKPALIYHRLPKTPSDPQSLRVVSYGQLRRRAWRCAHTLRRLGVGPGDAVVVLVPLSEELYEIMIGASLVGALIVFLDAWAGLQQLNASCALCTPKAFFGVPRAHLLRLVAPAFRQIEHKIIVGAGGPFPGPRYEQWLDDDESDVEPVRFQPDDAAMIAFTTGSSGVPKGVVRTQRLAVDSIEALNRGEMARHSNDVDMVPWPGFVLESLYHHRTCVIPCFEQGQIAEVDLAETARLIGAHGVTALLGPPVLYERLLAEQPAALASLRLAIVGGAPTPLALLELMQAALPQGRALVVYGSSECEPVSELSAAALSGIPRERWGGHCVGRLHENLQLRVIAPQRLPVTLDARGWEGVASAPGEIGELVVTGPQVATHYFRNRDAFAENKIADAAGVVWHRLGDVGRVDDTGNIWLSGRVHNMIEREDGAVFPNEIEAKAAQWPGVARAALVGWGDPPNQRAVLVLQPEAPDADLEALHQQARTAIAAATLPVDEVLFRYRLPLDPRHNSKIDAPRLRDSVDWHLRNRREGRLISTTRLTGADPWSKRFWAYLSERYEPVQNLVLTALITVTMAAVCGSLWGRTFASATLWLHVGLITLIQWFFYLNIRVFDEHKDWDSDQRAFPERILSQGLVTLRHLKLVGVVSTVAMFGLSIPLGGLFVLFTGIVFAYSLLMAKEFFVGEWLKRHLFLYGISHNAIVFLSLQWVIVGLGAAYGDVAWLDWRFVVFCLAQNVILFSVEVGRKIRMPEFERPDVDTYSQIIGYRQAAYLVLILQAVGLALLLLSSIGLHWAGWIGLGLTYGLVCSKVFSFLKAPTNPAAEGLKNWSAMLFLLGNAVIAATMFIAG